MANWVVSVEKKYASSSQYWGTAAGTQLNFVHFATAKKKGEASFDKVVKYHTYLPYDTVRTLKMDSVIVSFDFIADCCLTFSGRAEVFKDTLFLKYGLDREYFESCGCFCDYRLNYHIDKKNLSWSEIKIIHKKLIFRDSVDE